MIIIAQIGIIAQNWDVYIILQDYLIHFKISLGLLVVPPREKV